MKNLKTFKSGTSSMLSTTQLDQLKGGSSAVSRSSGAVGSASRIQMRGVTN